MQRDFLPDRALRASNDVHESPEKAVEVRDYNSEKNNRTLKLIVVILIALLIVVSSVGFVFYTQLNALQNHAKASQPQFVHLIDPQQLSSILGEGNWSRLSSQQTFYNSSNPTGTFQSEILQRTSPSIIIVTVQANGFNSSIYADFSYQNYQLEFTGPSNFTETGVISPLENYTLFGLCTSRNSCSTMTGIALSSLYVVKMTAIAPVFGQIPQTLNASVVKNLLQTQLLEIGTST
ncbi:MAG: hypothetical protein JRN15_10530 [Nitrososphaerota archaeon]|nr:hypothetical protein [Nitrososphaerota archaeon]